MKKRVVLFFALLIALTYSSCSNDTIETVTVIVRDTVCPPPAEVKIPKGYYLISEGTYGKGDSQLSFYNNETKNITMDYYGDNNSGAKIGDTAQDFIVYGEKGYLVMNGSNKVVVININDGKMLKEIDMMAGDKGASPRFAVGTEDKVYVSTWHNGVMVIDTTSLTLGTSIKLSQTFSEGIAYVDGNIYVANSGVEGEAYGGNGNTISIVSVEEQKETGTIEVPSNPNTLKVAKNGDMYLTTWGNWYSVDAHLHKIDYKNKSVEKSWSDIVVSKFAITDKYIYTYHFSYITYEMVYKRIHRERDYIEDFAIQSDAMRSVYGVVSDSETNEFFFSCESGLVSRYDESGQLIEEFSISIPDVFGVRTSKLIPVY